MHEVELLYQKTVMRGEMYLAVEPPVRPRQRRRPILKRVVRLHHFPQDADLLRGGVTRRKPGGQPLQRAAHHV